VYYWSPLWPYLVNSQISLDGEVIECVNLEDFSGTTAPDGHETVKSAPVWGRTGLLDTQHQVVISSCGPYTVVDAFTYVEICATFCLAYVDLLSVVIPS
jgi:hypothetical protein